MPPPTPPAPWVLPRPLPLPIHTPRLRLDVWRPADAQGMWDAVASSRASLLPWLPWAADGHRDVEDTRSLLENWERERAEPELRDIVLGIFDAATGAPLGGTGFHRFDAETSQAEIGYWMREDRRSQGLCTEAVRALVTSGFRDWGFRRIVIGCASLNVASRRVAEKAGLPLEGCRRAARWVDGLGWSDSLSFGVLVSEWDVARGAPRPGLPARRS